MILPSFRDIIKNLPNSVKAKLLVSGLGSSHLLISESYRSNKVSNLMA